jgi:hypothetical protein
MDCRTSLCLAKSGMVGKSKNRRTAERFLKFSTASLTYNKCKQKCSISECKDGNLRRTCQVFADSCWQPPLQLADSMYLGFSPAAFRYRFPCIAERLSNSFWAFPSGFPIPMRHFPAAVLYEHFPADIV